jgi:hypothetical protein
MKPLASLDSKDRKLLIICLASVVILAVLIGLLARNQNQDNDPMPSSYLTGRHGARAAFELLQASGYTMERWEQPLSELATRADAQTVVILAEPYSRDSQDSKAVKQLLERGSRVLITGTNAGQLLPDSSVTQPTQFQLAPCKLTPQGLDPLAGSGVVWMSAAAGWKLTNPRYRVQYNCANDPVVVEYEQGTGHIVWWASSTPLENASISRDGNLSFFLNALGARDGHRFYWDESLHGEVRSQWFYARGPALNLLLAGICALGLLTILSFSRRSGPVRDLPLPPRSSPVEFLEALGQLYAKAGASAAAVYLTYERFRRKMSALCGLNGMQMSAADLGSALRRRFPQVSGNLEADMTACEGVSMNDKLAPRRALVLVQALARHSEWMESAARANGPKR